MGAASLNRYVLLFLFISSSWALGDDAVNFCDISGKHPDLSKHRIAQAAKSTFIDFFSKLEAENTEGFEQFTHRRIEKPKKILKSLYRKLNYRFGSPWSISQLRSFEVRPNNGNKAVIACPEGVRLVSLYGYSTQYVLVSQVMAEKNLARILTHWVPVKNQWRLVGLHIQQWTHGRRDAAEWLSAADLLKNKLQRYLYLDISRKLLDGGRFLIYSDRQRILEMQESLFSKESLVINLAQLVQEKVVSVGSILAEDKVGLLVRIQVPKLLTSDTFKDRCISAGVKLKQAGILDKKVIGLRCQIILESEPLDNEGVMGSRYFSTQEIK